MNDSLLWNLSADRVDGDDGDDDYGDDDDEDDDESQHPIDKQTADNSANTVADKWSFGEETEQICSYNDQSAVRLTIQEACFICICINTNTVFV